MPPGSTTSACKLLKGLLNRDVQKRWGTAKSTMFEVGGVAGLKMAEFFDSIDWDKLERKEIDPPMTMSVQNQEDLKHFHEEFTEMPLPRSVVEMSKDDFRPHRVNSETFRGFSFIQEDFNLPERDMNELHSYWYAVQEDGESVSDCASSKLDAETGKPPIESALPEKKKRPPRKRKKKKNADASAGNTPVHSATTTPAPSVSNDSLGPSEGGHTLPQDTLAGTLKVDMAPPATPDRLKPSPSPARPSSPVLAMTPKPKPVRATCQHVSSAKKGTARNGDPSLPNHRPSEASAQQRSDKSAHTPQKALSPHSASTHRPWGPATSQGSAWNSHSRPTGGLSHQPQAQGDQGRLPEATGAPSSGRQQQPRGWAEPLAATDSAMSSSDWTRHSMSPRSNKSLRRIQQLDQQKPSWPSLGVDDPPLTSGRKDTGSAIQSAKLQGAWAARTKR